jgi:hypothetical protein
VEQWWHSSLLDGVAAALHYTKTIFIRRSKPTNIPSKPTNLSQPICRWKVADERNGAGAVARADEYNSFIFLPVPVLATSPTGEPPK